MAKEIKEAIHLGHFLKEKRELAGLSQKDVATKLGYSTPQFVSNWERGISTPPLKTLKKIGDLYKVSPDELFNVTLNYQLQQMTFDLKKKFYGKKAASL
ncbi:MAG: helix-turn-helix domain-containing protein [Bdellovibrionia bacterium]